MVAHPKSDDQAVERRLPRTAFGRQPTWRPAFLVRGNKIRAPLLPSILLRLRTVILRGSRGNEIVVGRGFRSRRLGISIGGGGNRIEIGEDVTWSGHVEVYGFDITIRIGDRCDGKGVDIVAWEKSIHIGSDCLFAQNVEIRSTDIHPIIDRATGQPVNAAAEVHIGNHVWIASHAALLKGTRLADGCIVGTRSVVTTAFDEPDCIIAGNPARIVRRNIAWRR